jgi:acyl carrier protein
MGGDGTDLFIAVEDAFQIHFTDEEARDAYTVGALYDLVVAKLDGPCSKRCLTSWAFYRTRRGIVETLGIDRRQIRPATPLEDLLPRDGRRENWRRIQAAMKLKLPDLQHPAWLHLSLMAACAGLTLALAIYHQLGLGWILLSLLPAPLVGTFLILLFPYQAVVFPNSEATVGDLARDVLALNHARLVDEIEGWNRKDAWEALCGVIAMETFVGREKITAESSFVDDLGIE